MKGKKIKLEKEFKPIKSLSLYRKDRYYVNFLTKEGSIFRLHKRKRIKPEMTEIKSSLGLHIIDSSKVSYRKKNKYYIFFNLSTNIQLGLICFGDDAQIPPDMLKSLLKKNVIKQLSSQLMGSSITSMVLFFVVGCVAGLGLGWILKEMVMNA